MNMMGDQYRKVEQYSPKSSPRGARSPVVSRQDSTGTLKTTISLGKNPSIVHSGPFYLMKEPPGNCAFIYLKNPQHFSCHHDTAMGPDLTADVHLLLKHPTYAMSTTFHLLLHIFNQFLALT